MLIPQLPSLHFLFFFFIFSLWEKKFMTHEPSTSMQHCFVRLKFFKVVVIMIFYLIIINDETFSSPLFLIIVAYLPRST